MYVELNEKIVTRSICIIKTVLFRFELRTKGIKIGKKKKSRIRIRKVSASPNKQLHANAYTPITSITKSVERKQVYIFFICGGTARTLIPFIFPRSGPRSGWRRSLLSRCRVLIARALRCVAGRNRRSHVRVTRLPCDARTPITSFVNKSSSFDFGFENLEGSEFSFLLFLFRNEAS